MTAQQKVKTVYPQARCERYRTNGGSGYSLVWSCRSREAMRLSEGKTAAEAWRNAANKLQASIPNFLKACESTTTNDKS